LSIACSKGSFAACRNSDVRARARRQFAINLGDIERKSEEEKHFPGNFSGDGAPEVHEFCAEQRQPLDLQELQARIT